MPRAALRVGEWHCMLGDGIAADGGALHSELHTKATMRKRRGQWSSKQGKRQERSTTCGVFLAIQIKMAIFAYLKLYSQNNT